MIMIVKTVKVTAPVATKGYIWWIQFSQYTAVLTLLIFLLVFLMVSRTDLDARLMRTAGMTYTSMPDGRVANLYNLKLANKTHKDIPVYLKLENMPGEITMINKESPVIKKEDYTSWYINQPCKIRTWLLRIIMSRN